MLELEGDLCGDGDAFGSDSLADLSASVLIDMLDPAAAVSLSIMCHQKIVRRGVSRWNEAKNFPSCMHRRGKIE